VGLLDLDVLLIDVRAFHALGQAVARRAGVRHESPQVIVLRDGVAVWDADHWEITTEAVAAALRLLA
jgi:bacillithiol system protein YtxJ